MLALPTLPDETATVEQLAEWWAAHADEIAKLRSFLYRGSARLTEAIRDAGPIPTPHGLLQILPAGFDWDESAVAEVMPSLVTQAEATFSGTQEHIERVLSLVLEELPDIEYSVARKIDKSAASRVIRQPGAAAEALAKCRTPKGRLGVG